ncbi:MAG: efflux RND transporter periplasmic adaptor subunit [Planctomycetes bacterium]|nr:efflux RND transporter periplasmic adaptor subunit [Planctomycetota bacterium]
MTLSGSWSIAALGSPAGRVLRKVLRHRPVARGLVFLAGLAVLSAASGANFEFFGKSTSSRQLYEVTRGDSLVTVTARGTLQCQRQTEISCGVYNLGQANGTQILRIVSNGASVDEGDVLIELDSSAVRERLEDFRLRFESYRARQIQAEAQLKARKVQNATKLADAEQTLDLAELAQKMYYDHEGGTYLVAVQAQQARFREAKAKVSEMQAALALQETQSRALDLLHSLGYRSKQDVVRADLSTIKTSNDLAAAVNAMAITQAAGRQLEHFDHPIQQLKLKRATERAKARLEQVKLDNYAELIQAESRKFEADRVAERLKDVVLMYEAQLAACTIRAPHAGMVVYAIEDGVPAVREGEVVHFREKLITLPELSRMQVKTVVHENGYHRIAPGMQVDVRIEAFPDQLYRGSVSSIAAVPESESWISGDVKVFPAVVTIDGPVSGLRPGMTSVVDIQLDRVEDAVRVPVEAVVEVDGQDCVYVDGSDGVELRVLETGGCDGDLIEVYAGVEPGEQVVCDPENL